MCPLTEKEVADARRVLAEYQDQQARRKAEANKKYIGRFFKYRNTYGAEGGSWWLYGTVTGVEEFGRLYGITFQETSDKRIEITYDDPTLSTIVGDGNEISADEFRSAVLDISGTVAILTNKAIDGR